MLEQADLRTSKLGNYFNQAVNVLVESGQLFGRHPQFIVLPVTHVLHRKLLQVLAVN